MSLLPRGPTGATGPTGPRGPTGATGATGATGPRGFSPSANGTTVTDPGAVIVSNTGDQYALTAGGQITVNGGVDPITANVLALVFAAPAVWQHAAQTGVFDGWWVKTNGAASDPWIGPTSDAPVIPGGSGTPGPTGATGASGPAGATGPAGPMGPSGTPGIAGARGPTGPSGLSGSIGATGATGPSGVPGTGGGGTGPTGAVGPTGGVGPSGAPGANGPPGPAGPTGSPTSILDFLNSLPTTNPGATGWWVNNGFLTRGTPT